MNNKVKFQFEMPQANANRLIELANDAGVTRKEIINNALTILEWAIKEVQAGNNIAAIDETQKIYKELALPLLQNVAEARDARVTTTA